MDLCWKWFYQDIVVHQLKTQCQFYKDDAFSILQWCSSFETLSVFGFKCSILLMCGATRFHFHLVESNTLFEFPLVISYSISNAAFSPWLRTPWEEPWPRKSTSPCLESNDLPFMHLLVTMDTSMTEHTPLPHPSGGGKSWREGSEGQTQRHRCRTWANWFRQSHAEKEKKREGEHLKYV